GLLTTTLLACSRDAFDPEPALGEAQQAASVSPEPGTSSEQWLITTTEVEQSTETDPGPTRSDVYRAPPATLTPRAAMLSDDVAADFGAPSLKGLPISYDDGTVT